MSDVAPKFWRIKNPVMWGVLTTTLILGLAALLAFQETCILAGNAERCQSKFSYLISATPNEVGDTLAGVAGVLAFIWIIVTVAIQAEELRAQREVLRLTRDEMEEQRKATQEMAIAQKTQAEVLEQQIDLLRHERELREIRRFEELQDEKYILAESILNGIHLPLERLSGHLKWRGDYPSSTQFFDVPKRYEEQDIIIDFALFGNPPQECIKIAKEKLKRISDEHIDSVDTFRKTKVSGKVHFDSFVNYLDGLSDVLEACSASGKQRIENSGVLDLLVLARKLQDADIWEGPAVQGRTSE